MPEKYGHFFAIKGQCVQANGLCYKLLTMLAATRNSPEAGLRHNFDQTLTVQGSVTVTPTQFKSTNENMKLYKMNETYILYRDYVPLIMMEITNKSLNHYLVELNGMWMYYTANRQPGSGQHQLRSAVQLTQIAWGNQTQKQLQKFELLRSRNCIALLVVWQAEC